MGAEVILGDWGSSRMRLWRRETGTTAPAHEGSGILEAKPDCGSVLSAALAEMDADPRAEVWLCGMAGARDALLETPYLSLPADSEDWRAAFASTKLADYRIRVAPGLRSPAGTVPDVMRGEEAQVFGALALGARADGAAFLCPGTHSKWIVTSGNSIVDFATVPTGEVYARLLGSSLAALGTGHDAAGFAHGLERAEEGPNALFEARAAQLLEGRDSAWARGYLSGLLIGMEIGSMRNRIVLSQDIVVIGETGLARLYFDALSRLNMAAQVLPADRCTLAGLELALDH